MEEDGVSLSSSRSGRQSTLHTKEPPHPASAAKAERHDANATDCHCLSGVEGTYRDFRSISPPAFDCPQMPRYISFIESLAPP